MSDIRKLPADTLDGVIRRLVATYGRRFWNQYEGVDPADVRAVWARELAVFADKTAAIAWAFENLPENPPNAIEFKNLCRRMPAPPVPQIAEPRANPDRVAQAIAQARAVLQAPAPGKRSWLQRVRERIDRGESVSFVARRYATGGLVEKTDDPA